MERIVGGHYKLGTRIGAGSFGKIFTAENIHSHRKVAIKMENSHSRVPQLAYESKLYAIFSGGTGIPRLHWYGTEGSHNIMIIDLLGKSLEDLFVQCHHRFSLKTVLMLADQMISCVEFLHNKNFIHRDIKPDNFAMGLGSSSNQVFIIDYGLSKKYRDQHTHTHIPYIEGKSLTGTARYASVGALKGIEQSRRDDLESLGYVWLYLLRGGLPWMGLNGKDQKQKYNRICDVKSKTSFVDLCKGFPNEFVKYFNAVRSLRFTDKPNYSELKQMFRDLFIKLGYVYDYQYDWVKPNSNSSQIIHSRQSIYSQVISEAKQQKGNNTKVSIHNNQLSKQASMLAKIHSIPVFSDNENNAETKNTKSRNQPTKPNTKEKNANNQSCFVVNKNPINKNQDNENVNENNSLIEQEAKPNKNTNLTKNVQNRNRIPQSALAGGRREKLHRQQTKNEQEQLMAYNRMNNLNTMDVRNSSNYRLDRGVTQRNQNESRPRTRNGNLESPRRKVTTNASRMSTARKNTKENNQRRILMDYWLEESRNRRLASNKQRAPFHS